MGIETMLMMSRQMSQRMLRMIGTEQRMLGSCYNCLVLQNQPIATSPTRYVAKAKNTKKKLVKAIHFRPKSLKMQREVVTISPNMTVAQLAAAMGKDTDHVFETFLYIPRADRYDSDDSEITDLQIIKDVLDKSGFRWKLEEKKKVLMKESKDIVKRPSPDPNDLVKRPPIVTIMGHVDHGKTTLLDAIRHSHVVDQEFGGITQHIGAFSVKMPSGDEITFLDTPGHAAFHAMRARGAHTTDIIVLVVAAEDGVMKQTQESIALAKESKVPIIVALNKIDKHEANIEAAKRGLLGEGLELEEYGGDIQVVPISALKGTNLHELKECIVALAEVLEVKADPLGLVEAVVIESKTDPKRGKLATIIVQRGTLKRGSCLVAGTAWVKVRGMFNDKGKPVSEVKPGVPVEIIGWKDLPSAGQEILQVESEKRAREVVAWRDAEVQDSRAKEDLDIIHRKQAEHDQEYHRLREERLAKGFRRGNLYKRMQRKEVIITHTGPELPFVLKGDVDGSVEAIMDTLDSYHSDQCKLHILQYGVGAVSLHDVEMAANFNGIVYAFNVPTVDPSINAVAKEKGVEIRRYNVIYKLFDNIREELNERLPTVTVEEPVGEAQVLQTFTVTDGRKKLHVAGCRCNKGFLSKKHMFKLVRDGEEIIHSKVHSLKHFKNEVDTIKTDVECGLSLNDTKIHPEIGDTIVCYELKETKQEIQWELDF